ncbi:MAG: DUF126 domain-containing protein [Chloroflexi bacterium]|nr:DUF126 domain-containing protein [Chloroflexota bacterium]
MHLVLHGRLIHGGTARGQALVSPAPIGFLGGVDPETGIILDPDHPLQGQSIAGKILVFPHGKGSTVGSYTILRLKKAGAAPLAMINANSEAITAVGAIIADIPMVDQIDISFIRSGDDVSITDARVEIRRQE